MSANRVITPLPVIKPEVPEPEIVESDEEFNPAEPSLTIEPAILLDEMVVRKNAKHDFVEPDEYPFIPNSVFEADYEQKVSKGRRKKKPQDKNS